MPVLPHCGELSTLSATFAKLDAVFESVEQIVCATAAGHLRELKLAGRVDRCTVNRLPKFEK